MLKLINKPVFWDLLDLLLDEETLLSPERRMAPCYMMTQTTSWPGLPWRNWWERVLSEPLACPTSTAGRLMTSCRSPVSNQLSFRYRMFVMLMVIKGVCKMPDVTLVLLHFCWTGRVPPLSGPGRAAGPLSGSGPGDDGLQSTGVCWSSLETSERTHPAGGACDLFPCREI